MKGKISDTLERAIQNGTARSLLRSRRSAAMIDPTPKLAPAVLRVPEPDLRHKEIPVTKQTALQFLRAELTEDRTDRAIQFIGDQAKLILPDIPVEIAERLLDFLMPDRMLDAIEHVLD